MINYVQGDILQSNDDAIVNPINCVGVMGKGLALQFRKRYPEMFEEYKRLCAKGEIITGKMYIYCTPYSPLIIGFPTKLHWNQPSKLSYIADGLIELHRIINKYEFKSISIPMLGTGLGDLNCLDVKRLIERQLSGLHFCEINVYENN